MQQTPARAHTRAVERKAVRSAPHVRSELQLAVPAPIAGAIDQVAMQVQASKSEAVLVLINDGLALAPFVVGAATGRGVRLGFRCTLKRAILALLLVLASVLPAHAKRFCMVKVHGKGGPELAQADGYWAEDYWANGQFQSIAQPCGGMPALTTHADGTVGTDVAFNRYYCGCGTWRWNGCTTLLRPADGSADNGTMPAVGCVGTKYATPQFPLRAQDEGVLEQINRFLDQTGCDDLTIVTHSNGGNIIRWGFSLTWLYDSCTAPTCATLKAHQERVINATTHVLILHTPSGGSEAANLAATLSGSWLTGWMADWLGGNNRATQELTTGVMASRNATFMFGTTTPVSRPWPTVDAKGNPLRVARWIAFVSPTSLAQIIQDGAHPEDYELVGCATAVGFPNGNSDGLVSWPSQALVGQIWYFTGQHDTAANQYSAANYRGNNHHHARLGGGGGGGQWRPLYWREEPTYLIPGVSPPLAGPGPCWNDAAGNFLCQGWPWPSTYHGIAVAACPDSICKANQTRGYPAGADEAFAISAFIGARAASVCGPAINNLSVFNGQYQTTYVRRYAGPGLINPYWQSIGNTPLYDTYAPNAGTQVCQWQC